MSSVRLNQGQVIELPTHSLTWPCAFTVLKEILHHGSSTETATKNILANVSLLYIHILYMVFLWSQKADLHMQLQVLQSRRTGAHVNYINVWMQTQENWHCCPAGHTASDRNYYSWMPYLGFKKKKEENQQGYYRLINYNGLCKGRELIKRHTDWILGPGEKVMFTSECNELNSLLSLKQNDTLEYFWLNNAKQNQVS